MWSLCGYRGTASGTAGLQDIPALVDPTLDRQNGHYRFPSGMKLLKAYSQADHALQFQLQSPSLRRVFYPDLWPFVVGHLPPSQPNYADYGVNPLTIPTLEEIAVFGNPGANADIQTALLAFGDGMQVGPVGGEIFSLCCTAAITAVAGAWTQGNLTLSQTLPTGMYALTNAYVESTTCVAFRFILAGYPWRPGWLGQASTGGNPWLTPNKVPMGTWLTFPNTLLPTLEILCNAADASQTVWLDLIKIA